MNSRFFEIQPTWNDGGQIIGFTYTQLRNNQTYINYYTLWFRLITTAIIPFILMLICNLGIIVYYRKNRYDQNLCSKTSKYTVFSWIKKIEMVPWIYIIRSLEPYIYTNFWGLCIDLILHKLHDFWATLLFLDPKGLSVFPFSN